MKIETFTQFGKWRSCFLLFALLFLWQLPYSQAADNFPIEKMQLEEAFFHIGKEYGVFFNYDREIVADVTVEYESGKYQKVEAALQAVFRQTHLQYQIFDQRFVAVYQDSEEGIQSMKDMITHFQGIVDEKENVSNRSVAIVPPLSRLSLKDIYQKRIVFSVTGTVTDQEGEPLIGVNIQVKESSKGTATDFDGNFTLEDIDENAVLVVSYVGYQTQEVVVAGKPNIEIVMISDSQLLDEVVVIGYGAQKKSDLTGSVGSVNVDQLKERPSPSLNQSLSGRIAGVKVNVNSGRPGGRSNVKIRGFSSINSSNNPLYVVDGVMLSMSNQPQFSQAIDFINPNDIVSVEVLKDASSTAIYGARGANGVILITTKRGQSGEGRVTYNGDFSVPTIGPNRPQVLNAKEYLAVEDLAWKNMEKYDPVGWNDGKWAYLNPALRRTDPRIFDSQGNPLYDTDWFKETTQNKLSQNHQLGFSGGNDRSNYSVSMGYRDDIGLIKTSFMKRYSGRLTFDDNIKNWLRVGGTLSYNNQSENLVDINDAVSRQIVEDFPFMPVKYEDGTFANNRDYPYAEGTMSSMHRLFGTKYNVNTQTIIGSIYSNITIFKNLELRSVFGTNMVNRDIDYSITRTLAISQLGSASLTNIKESQWSFENYLNYFKEIAGTHSFNGLLGISWQENNGFRNDGAVDGFSTDYFNFNNLGAGSTNPRVSSNASRYAFNSYFGRANYTLLNKYLFTITGRVDGSSKFGENNKFAFFPSAALGWRVSEEEFLQQNETISNLKLRLSYGVSGNSEIPPYTSLSLLSSNYAAVLNNARVGGTGLSRLANEDLRWEKTAQSDFGVEIGLFDNKISFEGDIYYRKTTDMLLDAPVPRTSGYAVIRKNVGEMENKGYEISVTTINFDRNNFSWQTIFNISGNRNKVLSLATPDDIFDVGGPNFTNQTSIIREGEAVGSFWGLVRLGVWSEAERAEAAEFTSYRNGLTMLPGDLKYLDVNGDKVISDADRMIIGNGYPKAWGALLNSFKYKSIDLTLEIQYSYGNDMLDLTLHPSEDRQALANSYKTVLDAWRPDNQNSMVAEIRDTRAGYVTNVDSHWVKDGSFIRGSNLLLGYTLPSSIFRNLKDRPRVYLSTQNFFLLVHKDVIGDPETQPIRGGDGNNVFSEGISWHGYPKPTVFMAGVQLSF